MTNIPAIFRRSVESMYAAAGSHLCPFMETAMKGLEAVFESTNKRSLARKEAVAALMQTGAYKGTPYERADGWQNTDLKLIKDTYNKYVAKGNRSKMIAEVAEDEPEPWVPSNRMANLATQQQPKTASQPAQNTQAQNNPAVKQNTNAAAKPNPSATQQPQLAPQQQPKMATRQSPAKAVVQPATQNNANSGATQNRAAAPQPQPVQKTKPKTNQEIREENRKQGEINAARQKQTGNKRQNIEDMVKKAKGY
ncbi:MAG: hypothetical protein LBH25_01085 [Fibromonadaceae bacterium]|jgi:hypothetical protein|nr:hypothetical protein [Fibromonadaceae bacterium]